MSSTRRKKQEEPWRDWYETPAWPVKRLLEKVQLPKGRWIEPCAGSGHIINAVSRVQDDIDWTAVELREECREKLSYILRPQETLIIGDFLSMDFNVKRGSKPFDVALTNPPFSLAMEFVYKMLEIASTVVILQRLNWLGSGTRNGKNEFLQSNMPNVSVVPNRVGFTINNSRIAPNGDKLTTDSIEYAFFVWWDASPKPKKSGLIQMLDETPVGERRFTS